MPSSESSRLKLRISPAAEKHVRAGHPWVYDQSIREQNRPGQTGEIAAVYDRQDRLLALGLFDAQSPIRLRVLQTGRPAPIDQTWWHQRFDDAIQRRAGLFDDQTNGYRLIHGESDGWPGLVLDRYADTGVIKIYSAVWFARLPELLPLFLPHFQRLIVRLSRGLQATETPWRDGDPIKGSLEPAVVKFLESGLCFEADVRHGQKTGFFLDQRENRRMVQELASGRRTLNTFSYSGAFSIYAARGGAPSVTDLDINTHALQAAERHFALNREAVGSCSHASIQADAFRWLEEQTSARFDLVILDPPSLAKRQSERPAALRAYHHLAKCGLRSLRPNGILLAASCSAHVTAEEFVEVVRNVLRHARRPNHELRITGHPADHPAAFAEAQYLKCIAVRC
jgi:23S rRNA (cytosine1962-C5)-methyltransferase